MAAITCRALAIVACALALAACAPQQAGSGTARPGATGTGPPVTPSPGTPAPTSTAAVAQAGMDIAAGALAPSDGTDPVVEASTEMAATASFPDSAGRDIAYLTAVEVARHEGFDRVVWTFDGTAPAYRLAYVARPIVEDGSGTPIDVRGDEVLQIILTPAAGSALSGDQVRTIYEGPQRIDGAQHGAAAVQEVVLTGDFEATMSWAIGVDRRAPFTVDVFTNPTRVVVDIAAGGR